jgi:hypothetical protein
MAHRNLRIICSNSMLLFAASEEALGYIFTQLQCHSIDFTLALCLFNLTAFYT